MEDRIGVLHVHYRVAGGSPASVVRAGAVDRALQRGLAQSLTAHLARHFGADPRVTVVRSVAASMTLPASVTLTDARVVERVGNAAVDAIARHLALGEGSDELMRFTDETEFIGSFIADLLRGVAWERWYFGAFRRYQRPDTAETLRALLEDHAGGLDRVFDWLRSHGHFEAVRELLGAEAERPLTRTAAATAAAAHSSDGTATLAAAAMRLLELLGHERLEPAECDRLVRRFVECHPAAPAWTDRREVSRWVLEWLLFVRAQRVPPGQRLRAADHVGLRAALSGPLDWLDGPWLLEQLGVPRAPEAAGISAPAPVPSGTALIERDEHVLARLAQLIRGGAIQVTHEGDAQALVERLLAAPGARDPEAGPPDETLIAVLTVVARGFFEFAGGKGAWTRAAPAAGPAATSPRGSPPDRALRPEDLRDASHAATALLQAMLAATAGTDAGGEPTRGAGLYVLVRVLQDLRVPGLARSHGVPLAALLGGLAWKWLELQPPFDPATALWSGSERPDPCLLVDSAGPLADLNDQLARALSDHGTPDAQLSGAALERDAASLAELGDLSAAANFELGRTASLLLRGWARWLPGVRNASARFLIERCLRREAQALITLRSVDLTLAPAPLDVVVEMAGYYRPIAGVPWLGDRNIQFAVRRGPAARP